MVYYSNNFMFLSAAAAAAAAKSLQSCPTLCDPIDSSPPGSLSLGFSRQEHWSDTWLFATRYERKLIINNGNKDNTNHPVSGYANSWMVCVFCLHVLI